MSNREAQIRKELKQVEDNAYNDEINDLVKEQKRQADQELLQKAINEQ